MGLLRRVSLTVISLFLITALFSQNKILIRPDHKQISTVQLDLDIKNLMNNADVTGLQVGIISGNNISFLKSYGYGNLEAKVSNDTNTIFYAASLAKSVFAYIVMMLVDEKKMSLDTPLYKYLPKPLPEYEEYKDLATDSRWKLLTARQCLSHTTGFPNFKELNPRGNNKLEIFFNPGTRYAYSGAGINLLQFVTETITRRDLESIAVEKIFFPFKMPNTSYVWQTSFENKYALGYDLNNNPLRKRKRSKPVAAGSMETTLADYTRFMQAVILGKGLSPAAMKEMITPQIPINEKKQFPSLNTDTTSDNKNIQLSYALGWGTFSSPYGKAFFKEGHDDGWVHYCIAFPDSKYAVVLMSNSSEAESIYKELVEKLTGVTIPYVWENYMPFRPHISLPESALQEFVGEYDGKLNAKISLVKGTLRAESSTVQLPPSNLYAVNDHKFFLKVMEVELDFKKGPDGKINSIVVYDEGQQYELKKIN